MKRKKLTIDLGNTTISDPQMKKLLADVHTAVKTNLAKMQPPAAKKKIPVKKTLSAAAPATITATITATFNNTNPGLSELIAICNGSTKKLSQSGDISFPNLISGDVIIIQGKSLGNSDISIDVKASPMQMKFVPGTFNFNFILL